MENIKLYNWDCLDILASLETGSIDLIVTDPPYKTTPRGSSGGTGGMLCKEINKKGKVFKHNNIDCTQYASEFYRVLKDTAHCYVMSNHINLIQMLNAFTAAKFHFVKCLIWNKGNKIVGRYYMSQYEYILFFRKGKDLPINNCGTSDIISVPNIKHKTADGKNIHDTEKPTELMRILIENSTKKSDVVLDPFMGVGSTGVACRDTFRKFIGVEIDREYFQTAKKRIMLNRE